MFKAIEKLFTHLITWIAVTFFVVGVLLYIFQIVWRLLLSDSFFWIDALISYLLTLSALMGAALAVRTQENIKIDILRKYIKMPVVQLLVDGFSLLVTIALLLVFFYHSKTLYHSENQSSFGISDWILNIPYLFLFVGSLIYYINHLCSVFKNCYYKNSVNRH